MARPQKVSDEEIIEAARACIMEFGPAVSTSTIAKRVDVSAQALLKRFGGKENLVLAALQPLMATDWQEQLPSPGDERALVEQLRDVAHLGATVFSKTICAGFAIKWSVVSGSGSSADQDALSVIIVDTIADWLANLHRRGSIRKVDFQAVSLAFLGAIQVRYLLEHTLGQSPIATTASAYLDTTAELYASMLSGPSEAAPAGSRID